MLLSLWPGHQQRISLNRVEGDWRADKDITVGHQAWEEEGRAQARDSAMGWRGGARDLRPRRRMWHLTEHEDAS